jgi:AcrR family transcriptional regulator
MPNRTSNSPESGTDGARQEQIVNAAIPVFLRYGYKRASMDEVAARANLSRQAIYLHFAGKEALFAAVVNDLSESTIRLAREALWRPGLDLPDQLLAAFDETMPNESMDLLGELLNTAQSVVPEAVHNVDAAIVEEITLRLKDALAERAWPVVGADIAQAASVLQACSYGIKEQTNDRATYLSGMKAAIQLVLAAGQLDAPPERPIAGRRRGKA